MQRYAPGGILAYLIQRYGEGLGRWMYNQGETYIRNRLSRPRGPFDSGTLSQLIDASDSGHRIPGTTGRQSNYRRLLRTGPRPERGSQVPPTPPFIPQNEPAGRDGGAGNRIGDFIPQNNRVNPNQMAQISEGVPHNVVSRRESVRNGVGVKGIRMQMCQSSYVTGELGYPVFVGHCTLTSNILGYSLACIMVKKMFMKMSTAIASLDAKIYNMNVGDQILWYIQLAEDGANSLLYAYTYAANNTYRTVIDGLWATFISTLTAETKFQYMQFVPTNVANAAGSVRVRLDNAKVYFKVVSVLKFRNQTRQGATDDETTDIDSVPLKVRNYLGLGSGMETLSHDQTVHSNFLWCDGDGVGTATPGVASGVIDNRKLPLASDFALVNRQKNFSMAPGETLRDFIKTDLNVDLQRYVLIMGQRFATAGSDETLRYEHGHFSIFGAEAHIPVPAPQVTLGWEVDKFIDINMSEGRADYTTLSTNKDSFVTYFS